MVQGRMTVEAASMLRSHVRVTAAQRSQITPPPPTMSTEPDQWKVVSRSDELHFLSIVYLEKRWKQDVLQEEVCVCVRGGPQTETTFVFPFMAASSLVQGSFG